MGYTVCERLIKNGGDMSEVEGSIITQLGGENHRCAFFRSVPYIRLRIAALYTPNPTALTAYCGDLSVTMTPTADGPLVRVHCSYEPVYDFEKIEKETFEPFEPFEPFELGEGYTPCLKRVRTDV